MNYLVFIGAGASTLIIFIVGGLAVEGPLDIAIASSSGLERSLLMLLEMWPKLAHFFLSLIG